VASKIANPMLPGKDLYLCSHSHWSLNIFACTLSTPGLQGSVIR
jgi:hypothetical protein